MLAMSGTEHPRGGRGRVERIGQRGKWKQCAAAMLLAASAAAHASGACDALQSTLAERIEATGVRGYSLEPVPGRTPVPAGAKVIGTCEGGATKILYRRWGAAQSSSRDAAARPVPASAPIPTPAPVPVFAVAASAVTTVAQVQSPSPQPPPAKVVVALRTVEPAVAEPMPPQPDTPVEARPSAAARAADVIGAHWRWIAALLLLLLPLAAWLWAWRARRSYYDEAGLPRGPKL